MNRHPAVRRLLAEVTAACKDSHVDLQLRAGAFVSVDEGARVGGFFNTSTLAVATGPRGWWMTLAHEYCHLRQWEADGKIWLDAKDWFFDWVAGTSKRPKAKVREQAMAYLALELDCERRTVRLADKLELPYNRRQYIRAANAYLLFYAMLPASRVWYSYAPHYVDAIIREMPNTFMPLRWYRRPHPQYAALVFRHCLTPARQRAAWAWLLAA